jgi:hypothetical protein
MTRREGIKPRTVNELFVVIEAVARSDALYNMLDQALAHYMRERESYNEIEACRAPFGTDKKRKRDKPPYNAYVGGTRSCFHYYIQRRTMKPADIVEHLIVKAFDSGKHSSLLPIANSKL